jgi:hypothetical protein
MVVINYHAGPGERAPLSATCTADSQGRGQHKSCNTTEDHCNTIVTSLCLHCNTIVVWYNL